MFTGFVISFVEGPIDLVRELLIDTWIVIKYNLIVTNNLNNISYIFMCTLFDNSLNPKCKLKS